MACGATAQDSRSLSSSSHSSGGHGDDSAIHASIAHSAGDEPADEPSARAGAWAAMWDAVARPWHVVAAWLALRRPVSTSQLAQIVEPRRFVRAALVAVGRELALAVACLPRAGRDEAAIAVLACKSLVAFDRLSDYPAAARAQIAAAVGYLTGEAPEPPGTEELQATRALDRLDVLLAARLSVLRAALDALPAGAARRCRDLIERAGEDLIQARGERRGPRDGVLGDAVIYAARLAAPARRPPIAACKAAGRALRLACDLEGVGTARARDVLLDRALPALAFVPRLLRWLPAATGAGSRAAVVLAALTALPQLRKLAVAAPRRLRHPLYAALAAAWSRRAVLGVADALDAVLHDARRGLVARLDGPVVARVPLAVPPDAVVSDSALISLAMELVGVTEVGLRAAPGPRTAADPARAPTGAAPS